MTVLVFLRQLTFLALVRTMALQLFQLTAVHQNPIYTAGVMDQLLCQRPQQQVL